MKLPFLLNSVSRCVSLKEVESVFSRFLKVLPSLDGNTTSHCLNILAKKEINQPKFLWLKTAEILTESEDKSNPNSILSKFQVKDVCIILNAFAKVNFLNLKLIESGTSIIIRQIRNIHTRDLCNVIHSLGKLNQLSTLSRVINKLFTGKNNIKDMNSVLKVIKNCNEKDFSMLLRVLMLNSETLGLDSITRKLLDSLTNKYEILSDQTIAILSNSVAQYGRDENGTLSVLAPIITLRLRKGCFTPQCIAQISNGCAKLNFRDFELFSALSQRVLMNVHEFPPRSLANILNAFSKLNIFNKQLFTSLIPQFESNLKLMTPQCIGNTINAYSKFSLQLNINLLISFFNKMVLEMINFNSFDSFIGQNYANIFSGITKVYIEYIKSTNTNISIESSSTGNSNTGTTGGENSSTRTIGIDISLTDNTVIDTSSPVNTSTVDSNMNYIEYEEKITSEYLRKLLILLLKKMYESILEKFDEFNHLDVLMIFNSMARFQIYDKILIEKLLEKLKIFMEKYKIFELNNIVNSCSKFITKDLKTFPDSNTTLIQYNLKDKINNKINNLNNNIINSNKIINSDKIFKNIIDLKNVGIIFGISNDIFITDVINEVLILDYYKLFLDHLIIKLQENRLRE
uniref:RNA-editing substrate-binding complex 6 protein domain-containing protein n=1 Tax=Theileria annulata TaxID=5874 RepID=A0A3B0MTJ9_THEAN